MCVYRIYGYRTVPYRRTHRPTNNTPRACGIPYHTIPYHSTGVLLDGPSTYLENKVHAILRLVQHSSAHLPVLELYGDDTPFRVVQKDYRHADAGIAGDGH